MFARSITLTARPDAIDRGIAHVRDEVMPAMAEVDGCVGLSLMVDRETGRCIATSAWRTREAMTAADGRLRPLRERAAAEFGGSPQVEEWEIAVLHRDHAARPGTCVRCTWMRADPADSDRGIEVFRASLLPRLEEMDGFCSASLMIDRAVGRAVTSVGFDSREAMQRSRAQGTEVRSRGAQETGAEVVDVAEFELVLAHLRVPEMA